MLSKSDLIKLLQPLLLNCGGGPCGNYLTAQYAHQVALTGANTTTEDAFAAWLRWIEGEGGRPVHPLVLDECNRDGFHGNVARIIREVSRDFAVELG